MPVAQMRRTENPSDEGTADPVGSAIDQIGQAGLAGITRQPRAPLEAPTAASASRDAIKSLIDGNTAQVTMATAQVRKAIDALDKAVIANGARVKAELDGHVHLAEVATQEAKRLSEIVDELASEQAKLVAGA